MSFNRQKTCRHGQMIYNVHDAFIGRSLELYGEYSEGEVALFAQMAKPDDWVLDIGANIGAHTIFLAQQVGPAGRILAFEPQRIVFQTLCANLALNSIANAWCYCSAVGAEAGEVAVPPLDPRQPNNFGRLCLDGDEPGEAVPVITIDSLRLPRCNFIKIDVEGMEHAVIAGAVDTISQYKPFLYVENDRADRSAELIRWIDSLGYRMYCHFVPPVRPRQLRGQPGQRFCRRRLGQHAVRASQRAGLHEGIRGGIGPGKKTCMKPAGNSQYYLIAARPMDGRFAPLSPVCGGEGSQSARRRIGSAAIAER
jgi:FkbM family methyltransferase